MNIATFISVLDRNQNILIVADMASGFMRTTASEVPVTLRAKTIKNVYAKENEIVIETVSK